MYSLIRELYHVIRTLHRPAGELHRPASELSCLIRALLRLSGRCSARPRS